MFLSIRTLWYWTFINYLFVCKKLKKSGQTHFNQLDFNTNLTLSTGSLILHMMNSFLGDKAFQNGVSAYITRFSYNNSEQDDLWASLTEAAKPLRVLPDHTSVKDIMDTWTLQTGFPVVQVKRQGGNLTVSQVTIFCPRRSYYVVTLKVY